MKKERKNPFAKDIRTRKYRPRVKSSKKIYVRDIAPTLSVILGINFTALSTGSPIISAIK